MSIRDAIVAAKGRSETVEVAGVKVEVRAIAVSKVMDQSGSKSEKPVKLVAESVFDPESGEPIFRWPHDKALLSDMPYDVFEPLLEAVNRVNGFRSKDKEGNSPPSSKESSGDEPTS